MAMSSVSWRQSADLWASLYGRLHGVILLWLLCSMLRRSQRQRIGHSSCQAEYACLAAAWCDVFVVVVENRIFFVPDLKGQVSQMYAAAGLHGPVPVQNCGNVRLRAALPPLL